MNIFESLTLTSMLACLGLLPLETAPPPVDPVPVETKEIQGDCGDFSCPDLLNQLQQNDPERTAEFLSNCPGDPELGYPAEGELALNVYQRDGSQRVGFYCWAPPDENAERSGDVLGVLPYPGEEAAFPVPITSEDPAIQNILTRQAAEVTQMGFDCAVEGGSINILTEGNSIQLQCYFQAGVSLYDGNGDGISDGEYSMGAGVDFIRTLVPEVFQ